MADPLRHLRGHGGRLISDGPLCGGDDGGAHWVLGLERTTCPDCRRAALGVTEEPAAPAAPVADDCINYDNPTASGRPQRRGAP